MADSTDIFSEVEWGEIAKALSLSKRESQIIKELFADNSDKRIALDLEITISTVRTHISRLFRKLNADCRMDVILHVFRCFRDNCCKLNCPRQR
ncbi:MAG: LuxR C-terminal-related transcriptional regulator [Planctomycetaceae bacterium]|nr:LuxR C-terminal-related transcriptional regulator [Planctomycetaceae bacterium]